MSEECRKSEAPVVQALRPEKWTYLSDIAKHREQLTDNFGFDSLIGKSEAMLEVYEKIGKVATSDVSVMLLGETGTGKEVIAKAIHQMSGRAGGPFVAINCAAIPDNLFESELFGHEKGAFTGAIMTRRGVFEKAHNGTLFMDEVAETKPLSQPRLLRVLQERRFERVGGCQTIEVDVRIISASNRNLDEMIENGEFRMDLYYRLMVYPIHVPPLRDRKEDTRLLCEHFIRKHSVQDDDKPVVIETAVLDLFMKYDWPGNVRELENVIQFALVSSQGACILLEHLPPVFKVAKAARKDLSLLPFKTESLSEAVAGPESQEVQSMDEIEKRAIREALLATEGNVSLAARRLGLGRTTLYRKMSAYGMHVSDG